MTGRAQEETMMTTGQLASAGSSALEVTAPDETHSPAWPRPVPREIGTLPLSRLRRITDHIREHLDQDLTLAQHGAAAASVRGARAHRPRRRPARGAGAAHRPDLPGGGIPDPEPLLHRVPPAHGRDAARVPREAARGRPS